MCKVSIGITRHPGPFHLLLYTVCDTLSFNHFKLNTEEFSPLKGRIIQSAEKISKGFKAKEIIKILGKTFPENNVF